MGSSVNVCMYKVLCLWDVVRDSISVNLEALACLCVYVACEGVSEIWVIWRQLA